MDLLKMKTSQRQNPAVSLTTSANTVRMAQRLHHRIFAKECGPRYPGKTFRPYTSVGVGALYLIDSGMFEGRQIVPGLSAAKELTGTYSILHLVCGIPYHF